MAGRTQPDYTIRKDFHSTFDPLKHSNHVPSSPLYRPGQEHDFVEGRRSLPPFMNDDGRRLPEEGRRSPNDENNVGSGHLGVGKEMDDQSPRHTDGFDPRYGSAKARREQISFPAHNPTDQARETNGDNHDIDTHLDLDRPRTNSSAGGQAHHYKDGRQAAQGQGQGDGFYTDRPGCREDQKIIIDKPWQSRRQLTSGRVVDPRMGSMAYSDGAGASRLKHGGALLFIKFPTGSGRGKTENVAVAAHAFLRSKPRDMGGRFLGLAKSVEEYGYHQVTRDAIGVYHFQTSEKALHFFQYDSAIRQPDFPPPYGHAEMWTVCNAYLPEDGDSYTTFLISEIILHEGSDKREFFEVFQKPFEQYLSSKGVMPFVICSYGSHDRQGLRRHNYPRQTIVTCHLFQSIDHLRWFSDEDTYLTFRNQHNKMAEEKCFVFTLERNPCM